MTQLTWDDIGKRFYETGVDKGVLFIPDGTGAYVNGVAWNGLTILTETPSGAASTPIYADNLKYLNLISAEDFAADIEAYTYPDEFAQFDGLSVPTPGVAIAQQSRRSFGLCYRTRVGNDLLGDSYGYKLHMLYGCQAAPSQKVYNTVNASPAGVLFKWALSTTPIAVAGSRPTSLITVDSTKVLPATLTALEAILYGVSGSPMLPTPDTIVTMFSAGVTTVSAITLPTYTRPTLTIPTVTGVDYYVNGVLKTTAQTLTVSGPMSNVIVEARPHAGYVFASTILDTDWQFLY